MKRIKLRTCQGVGDIFWVYQKFAPHVDCIDISIAQVDKAGGKIGTRAVDFLRLLPKIGEVDTFNTDHRGYQSLAASYFPMKTILEEFDYGRIDTFNYGCNKPLECGIRIEDIDPEVSIEETVDIKMESFDMPFSPDEFISVYVSGTTENTRIKNELKLWGVNEWSIFIRNFYREYNIKLPIMLIGASYDSNIAIQLEQELKRMKFNTALCIDSQPANVTYILKHSRCFIGYQSGLNILADNLDTKQVMLYFPYLRKMLNTWCKIDNWRSGDFNAATFDMTPKQVLEGLRFRKI